MRGRFWVWVACVGMGMVLVAPSKAWGSLITFGDRAAFESTLGQFKKYSFDTNEGFPTAVFGGVPISSFGGGEVQAWGTGGSASIQVYPGYYVPGQVLWGYGNTLSLQFKNPQRAVGFEIVGIDEPLVPNAFVTIQHPGLPDEVLAVDAVSPPQGYRFFGAISSEPISGVFIDGTRPELVWLTFAGIDNLTISAIPEVPEPSVILWLMIGAMMFVSRRRGGW